MGAWDNFFFSEGLWILFPLSLIKKGQIDWLYAVHLWSIPGHRDRILINERKQSCLMACVTLSDSLWGDWAQPYGFQRALVTHIRVNMEHSRLESNENGVSFLDDASEKFEIPLQEQGYLKEAETLENKFLETRNRILRVEYPHTITTMANLTSTNWNIEKYTEAEKLKIQVLDAWNRIPTVQHPHTIHATAHLAVTYQNLGNYTKAEKLGTQILDAKKRILGVEHP